MRFGKPPRAIFHTFSLKRVQTCSAFSDCSSFAVWWHLPKLRGEGYGRTPSDPLSLRAGKGLGIGVLHKG